MWVREFSIGEAGRVESKDIGRIPDVEWGEEVHVYIDPYERQVGDIGWICRDRTDWELIEYSGRRVTHWMPLPEPPK